MDGKLDIVPVSGWGIFPDSRPCMIAGPCSAESEEQVMETAGELKKAGVAVFRAGIWKPRTRPGHFEGVGERGLRWLRRVKDELGMAVCTEVAGERHVKACLDAGIDMVWIGARTTTNPFLVEEIAESLRNSGVPVMVKNPINPDLELWIGALERMNMQGITKLAAVHRGFSTFERIKYRNAPDWQVVVDMRGRYPRLPFFCDPSHMAGNSCYIREISQKSLDLGLDGLMIECHCSPSEALSDSRQQITPSDLADMMHNLNVRSESTDDPVYNGKISRMRERIDGIDAGIVRLLGERMNVSREIGESKKADNISIIQPERWEKLMENIYRIGAEYSLAPEFIRDIFNMIHEASAEVQNKILERDDC